MQGMIAEYERAKIMERNRRGKLHGAKRGSVNVLSKAPYGYRYLRKQADGAPAQYVIDLGQAATVRQIFHWVGVERLSIGEVVRRLDAAGIETATGKSHWDPQRGMGYVAESRLKGDEQPLARREAEISYHGCVRSATARTCPRKVSQRCGPSALMCWFGSTYASCWPIRRD